MTGYRHILTERVNLSVIEIPPSRSECGHPAEYHGRGFQDAQVRAQPWCVMTRARMDTSVVPFTDLSAGSNLVDVLLRTSQGCIKIIDLTGALRGMNEGGQRQLEIDDFPSVCGMQWSQLWPASERSRIETALEEALAGRSTRLIAPCPTMKGAMKWWDVSVTPIFSPLGDVTHVLSVSNDVSHFRERETQLQRTLLESQRVLTSLAQQLESETRRLAAAQRRLSHTDKLRLLGQFVGNVVHDINNVLAVMQSASRAMRRQALEPRAAMLLEEVDKAVDRGEKLVRRLLDFARTDDSAAELFSPAQLIEREAELLRHLAGAQVNLKLDIADKVWPVVAEPARFQSVLFNLVSNARDALEGAGDITVSIKNCHANARPKGLPASDYVVFAISDNGAGMNPDILAKFGEPFFTTKGPGKGTGLGVASAFDFAVNAGGRVFVESALGTGTTVTLYLPRASALGEVVSRHDADIDPNLHGNAVILLLEDEVMLREHLAATLRGLNYVVLEAANEEVALAVVLREVTIDLVISDLNLGSGSGIHLVERLRVDRPELKVIFVTGSWGMGVPKGELIFRKPISEELLATGVLESLGRLPGSALRDETHRSSRKMLEKIRDPDIRQLLVDWQDTSRQLGRLPEPGEFSIDARALADRAFLVAVEVAEDTPVFRFVKAGSDLARELGRDLVGEIFTMSDQEKLGGLAAAYRRCLRGAPFFDYARLALNEARVTLFERLILPLSHDGVRVTHLAGVAIFQDITTPTSV